MEGESTKPKRKVKIGKTKKTTTPTPNAMRKIRLKPNLEVQNKLKQWFGCVRVTYNMALNALKSKKYPLNMFALRNRFVNACNIPKSKKYLLDTPKHVREGGLTDLVTAVKQNLQKGEHFEMKYRSRKDVQSIVIPKVAIKILKEEGTIKMYPTYLQNALKVNVKEIDKIENDCRLVMDKLGRFYLHVPMHLEYAFENQKGKNKCWASLDPGVRTFLTLYSPDGLALRFGHNDNLRLIRLCKHLDKLVSLKSKTKGRKKRRLFKAEQRIRNKVKNLVNDVHWKVINYLLSNFTDIVIPPFAVKEMSKKVKRVINNKTSRCLYNWRHFTFRQRLIQKAKSRNVNVFVRGEEFTTKTCTNCGNLNNVKGKKIIRCPKCHLMVDRDVSGARNIFLKNVSMHQH
jgi:putative transposase